MPAATQSPPLDAEMFETVEEYGRTFVRTKKYILPNDVHEQDRLDLQHAMCLAILGERLALAPIEDKPLDNVLDLATGTGIWANEFAQQHPTSNVVGTDLSKVNEDGKPPNCTFTIEDAEAEWTHPTPWNYIHGRALLTCFSSPKTIIQKAYDSLTPGGYLELQDPILPWKFATPPPPNSAFAQWNALSIEASIAGGRPWNNVQHYPRWLREVGFEDVVTLTFFVPTGTWSSRNDARTLRVGSLSMLNTNIALEGWTFRNLERIGWGAERTRALIEGVKDELLTGELRAYTELQVVYGRKPLVEG